MNDPENKTFGKYTAVHTPVTDKATGEKQEHWRVVPQLPLLPDGTDPNKTRIHLKLNRICSLQFLYDVDPGLWTHMRMFVFNHETEAWEGKWFVR